MRVEDAELMLDNIIRKEEVRTKNEDECLRDLFDSTFDSARGRKSLYKYHKKIVTLIYKTNLFRESQRLCSFVHVNDVMHLNAPSVGSRELQLLEDVFAYADDYTSINAKEHMTELVVFMKEHIQHEIARMRILIEANKFFKDETLNFRDDSQVFAGGGLTRNAGNRS